MCLLFIHVCWQDSWALLFGMPEKVRAECRMKDIVNTCSYLGIQPGTTFSDELKTYGYFRSTEETLENLFIVNVVDCNGNKCRCYGKQIPNASLLKMDEYLMFSGTIGVDRSGQPVVFYKAVWRQMEKVFFLSI